MTKSISHYMGDSLVSHKHTHTAQSWNNTMLSFPKTHDVAVCTPRALLKSLFKPTVLLGIRN